MGEIFQSLAERLSQIRSPMMAWTRLTGVSGDERAAVECNSATRPNIANPGMSSCQTLMTCFSLCVPVKLANEHFNNGHFAVSDILSRTLKEAAECAKMATAS